MSTVQDGTDSIKLAKVTNTTPASDAYGLVVRMVGDLSLGSSVEVANDVGNPVPVSGTVAATQSGTWTVQPGNTANTTAWKVDGSAVTQPVSGTVTANPTNPSSGVYGQVTVTTSGTEVQFDSNALTAGLIIVRALAGNTGKVYIGTNSSVTTSNGYELSPGEAVSFKGSNTNILYVDAATNGDKVCFLAS